MSVPPGARHPRAKDHILKQLVTTPEVMRRILKNLDLRALKQARLVCKSWTREVESHMKRRGTVRLYGFTFPSWVQWRIDDFRKTCRANKGPAAAPQPFRSVDVELHDDYKEKTNNWIINQLSYLPPLVVLTRFSSWKIPLILTIPLITKVSFSLEYLRLVSGDSEEGYMPPMEVMSPEQSFPQLHHLVVTLRVKAKKDNGNSHFPSIVSGIVEGSPNLQVYEAYTPWTQEIVQVASELLQKVDIQSVTTLIVPFYYVNAEALEHFLSIPFSQLQSLRVSLRAGPEALWSKEALVGTIVKSASTLRILDLSDVPSREKDELLTSAEFPICPYVHELTLGTFPNSKDFLTTHFPALKIMKLTKVVESESLWRNVNCFFGLRTLRIRQSIQAIGKAVSDLEEEAPNEFRFFEIFQALERLSKPNSLREYYPTTVPLDFSMCLDQRNKRLELTGSCFSILLGFYVHADYPWIGILRGIETVTMTKTFSPAANRIPLKELPCLQVFEFPWSRRCNEDDLVQLLRITSGVPKVVITNCCSIPRVGERLSNFLLETFMANPNVVCGCREQKRWPLLGF